MSLLSKPLSLSPWAVAVRISFEREGGFDDFPDLTLGGLLHMRATKDILKPISWTVTTTHRSADLMCNKRGGFL